jgi:methyl-accepting chemotaxis protein
MHFFTKIGLFTHIQSLKVTHKLSLLLAVMLLGFAMLGATELLLFKVEEEIQAETSNATAIERQIGGVNQKIAQALRYQRDFLVDKRLQLIESFEAAVSTSREALTTLENRKLSAQLKLKIAQVNVALTALHANTYELVETQVALGLDENSGIHGDLRRAAHQMETMLKTLTEQLTNRSARNPRASTAVLSSQLQLSELTSSMLLLRRHEKDFLQREDKKYLTGVANEQERFLQLLGQTQLASADKAAIRSLLTSYKERFNDLATMVTKRQKDRAAVDTALAILTPTIDALSATAVTTLQGVIDSGGKELALLRLLSFAGLGGIAVLVALIVFFLSRSITKPMQQLHGAVLQVTEGDMTARARLEQDDEIGLLANAFDTLLDERLAQMVAAEQEREARLAEAERENEALNNSVVNLLQSVAQLGQRDLTVRAPVAEDITGAVSDALNSLAEETATVLTQVTKISAQVATASRKVKMQSDAVVSLADQERAQVEQTSNELAAAAEAMNEIASHAQECNRAAEKAIHNTQIALETVTGTVTGINATRDIIRETEKRIKRLGERSQEISGVVNLINNIAERTHILALNASMHAASAGEAGRGFAVVADEVQRLAENARQATEQIATLVTNIQTETMDTVTTMNTAISQVVEGSRLAGQAGEQMQATQQTTTELVEAVQQIIDSLQVQANISNELRNRASLIVESTHQTSQELEMQDEQTTQLLNFASRLVETVGVFTLPGLAAGPANESGEVVQPAEGSSNDTEQAQVMAHV